MKKLAEFLVVVIMACAIWKFLKSVSEYHTTEEAEEDDESDFFEPFDSPDEVFLD